MIRPSVVVRSSSMRSDGHCGFDLDVASGNGITERCHRSVNRIAEKKRCTIAEAVFIGAMWRRKTTSTPQLPLQTHCTTTRFENLESTTS